MARGLRQRSVFRLELECGHTAFALPSEPHDKHRQFFCHAHDSADPDHPGAWVHILTVTRCDYVTGPPKALRKQRNRPDYERWGAA